MVCIEEWIVDNCWPVWNICVTNEHGYVTLVANTSRSFPRSWFITGFVTRLTRRVPLMEQELLILPEHLSSRSVFNENRVCFIDRCLSFWSLCCLFFFDLRILITLLVSSNSSYIEEWILMVYFEVWILVGLLRGVDYWWFSSKCRFLIVCIEVWIVVILLLSLGFLLLTLKEVDCWQLTMKWRLLAMYVEV